MVSNPHVPANVKLSWVDVCALLFKQRLVPSRQEMPPSSAPEPEEPPNVTPHEASFQMHLA